MDRNGPVENTDRELWREKEGDFYAPSLHVTKDGGIGMNVGGHIFVKPLRDWHALAQHVERIVSPSKESPALDKPAEGLEKFLENIATAKRCPVCPDQGWFPYETGGCDPDGENDTRECVQRQCEWCDTTPDGLFNRLGEAMAAHASIVKPLREKAEAAKLVIATAEQLRLEAEKGRDFYIRAFETERDERREVTKDRARP